MSLNSVQGHFLGGSIEITKTNKAKTHVVTITRGRSGKKEEFLMTSAELRALGALIKSLDPQV